MPGSEDRYEVHCSTAVTRPLYQLQQKASRKRKKHIATAFEQVVDRLQADPTTAGEPLYTLPAMRLRVRTVVVRPLVSDFAVSLDAPLVFIKGVKLLKEYQ